MLLIRFLILAEKHMEIEMNIYIGWLFKLIPLLMGVICIALGEFVLAGSGQSEYFVAGHVLISLCNMSGIVHYRIYYYLSVKSWRE